LVKTNDAYIRLGDCNFISKNYWQGMEAYNKVISSKGIDDDYAQYQKAISYGFVGRNDNKIKSLKDFDKQHPKSSYKDDALYELGNAYINAKENASAIATFDKLIETYTTSLYIPKVLLKQGLIFFNENNTDKSIEKYKLVVSKYPNAKEAQQAVQNARQVYVDIDKVDEYADWIREINYTKFTDIDLDNAMYEAAEKKYLKNETISATHSFKKYLINFPNGIHALKANFYSAQAYYSLENTEKALPQYIYVAEQSSNEYTEQALARLAEIYLEKNDKTTALPYLQRLELEANFPQNILFAQSNLMKIMYEQEKYKATVIYAEKVLDNKKTDIQIQSDARIFIARSAIKTNDLKKAEQAYSEVSKEAKGALKAEALYYDAYFKNKEGRYEESNKTVQELASTYANHKIWGVKGLIIMAENNIGLKDDFQATYILENVIENYGQYEDLIKEAKVILDQIQSAVKLNNKEVENNTTEKLESEESTEF
jgi:TolA-binding protein